MFMYFYSSMHKIVDVGDNVQHHSAMAMLFQWRKGVINRWYYIYLVKYCTLYVYINSLYTLNVKVK